MRHLASFVSRYPLAVILGWLIVMGGLRWAAPAWDDVTHDGNLAYLPADRPSVVGERWLEEAFPHDRAKSQIVVVLAREESRIQLADLVVGYDLARRFKNIEGAASLDRARQLTAEADRLHERGDATMSEQHAQRALRARQDALDALDDAVMFDELLHEHLKGRRNASEGSSTSSGIERLADAYFNRSLAQRALEAPGQAEEDLQTARLLAPAANYVGLDPRPLGAADWPLLDVWTWRDGLFANKLGDGDEHVRLIILQVANEFMDTANVQLLEGVEQVVAAVNATAPQLADAGLQIGLSGSAAIGGDMRRAAAASIKNTERFTLLLVLLILTVVYRAPLLVGVPLISIGVAFITSTSLIALLTQLDQVPGFSWWSLEVFTTSRIFIVAILFGAGTDYCLFLIARYKEELELADSTDQAMRRAMLGVGDALVASALTTIVGLGMMWFADFGKFRYTGPAIGLCLAVTLLTCVTLTPALLRVAGRVVFWPRSIRSAAEQRMTPPAWGNRWWSFVAETIVARPGAVLLTSILLLAPLAGYGFWTADRVTYDFASDLSPDWPSRRGTQLLTRHMDLGESGPLTVLIRHSKGDFMSPAGRDRIAQLSRAMYVPGVKAIRSATDPLGDFPPGARMSPSANRAWKRWSLQHQKRSEELFIAQAGELAGAVARFDLVLDADPFSAEAADVLGRIDERLHQLADEPEWRGAAFAYAGTTAGIRDLRSVTRADNTRIQVLVVAAVFIVLLVILRRPLICVYMMATVLLSYFVTMGLTQLYFAWIYGDSYQGLDWKAPLFLFVILVAVGQDYNVYLATRVFEEQQRFGPFGGLRRAIVNTGGIISSCGVIMAGTFFSMTSGSWAAYLPAWFPGIGTLLATAGTLRGIAELGFALALGVLLDTFVVRPLLVPAFFALQARWEARSIPAAQKACIAASPTAASRR